MKKNDLVDVVLSYLKHKPETKCISAGEPFISSSLQSLALQVVSSYLDKPSKIALAFPSLYDVQVFSDYLLDFLPSEVVAIYPKDEILRLGNTYSSKEMAKERLRTLYRIKNGENIIVLYNAAASLSLLASPDAFNNISFDIKKGDEFDRDSIIKKLSLAGYMRVPWTNGAFEFSTRGSILDVFSPSYDLPLRIEFEDDVVESIRFFSPTTLLSQGFLDSATILPASERPIDKEVAEKAKEEILAEFDDIKKKKGSQKLDYEDKLRDVNVTLDQVLASGVLTDANESLFPYFKMEKSSIYDYLKGFKTFLVEPEAFFKSQNRFKEDESAYYADENNKGLSLSKESIYELPSKINSSADYIKIELNILSSNDGIKEISATNSSLNQSGILLDEAKRNNTKVFVCLDEKNIQIYKDYLDEASFEYCTYPEIGKMVTIIPEGLTKGFSINNEVEFLSSTEIYGIALKKSRFLTRYKDFKPIKKYSELNVGDYIVEENNGIGIFKGITQYKGLDYITIQYAKDTTLMVPIEKFGSIRKYAGSEAARPSLDTIGGATWARKKAKIKSRLAFLADRLLNIYAEREKGQGIAFKTDSISENEFAKSFAYPLTGSQIKAWEQISADMEKPHPMDRLVAGDVGFGKTELAFKAIFKAVSNGYQAALLCPTTVLSRQHYEVAKERFEKFGVKIGILNRFNSGAQEKKTLEDIKNGNIDLVIGTHRLLSQDVMFKELGLLVVDEEQKFGVAQKERIKEITKKIDVLSLSATPIPRTLQMSLLTIRPMSTLDEAPQNRLPVKTYVCKENDGLIKEVISRELARGGQVYFLHNRIDSLYNVAGKIKKMFPNITVGTAHGQMTAEQLADVMNDFYDKKIEVLVSTSIIESGLDVPNVNTIIVENAQNFGLAQLYQIKGRVGRSSRLAYAYLFYSDYDSMTEEGKKRLKAIKDFAELGSGYKIAQEDLAIRGSGNILGAEQAGFVDSLGYETYTRLLKEVIEQKKATEEGAKLSTKHKTRFALSFTLDAYIPDDYASTADRINLYRELEDCLSEEEVKALMRRVVDSYGPLPVEVKNLFYKRIIEVNLDEDDLFFKFEDMMQGFLFEMTEKFSNIPNVREKIEKYLNPYKDIIKDIRFSNRRFLMIVRRTPDYINDIYAIVKILLGMDDAYHKEDEEE